jgi:GntR family transcriptional regulator, transcriptional repressor for pyruvate dehydrogenase complex
MVTKERPASTTQRRGGDPWVKPVVVLPSVQRPGRERLAVVVADSLKEMILGGQLQPGDRLPNESDLCDHFGVSRITIREAIQMLRALGMVEPTRGRGTFVREPDADARLRDLSYFAFDSAGPVNDLMDVRTLLEQRAAETAAAHVPASDRKQLRDLVDRMRPLAESRTRPNMARMSSLAELDTAFHVHIASLGGNLVLEQLMLRLMQILAIPRTRSLMVPGQALRSWQEHAAIANAIEDGRGEVAAARIFEHMESIREAILTGEAGGANSRGSKSQESS